MTSYLASNSRRVMNKSPAEERSAAYTRWFEARGFQIANFKKGRSRVTTYRGGEHIAFRLKERPGYTIYYKETKEGALIVFEVKVNSDRVHFEGYCPLLVFNIWPVRISFKPDARFPFKYRAEGYGIAQDLARYVSSHS